NPAGVPEWMRQEINRLAKQYQFFHWHLAFPEVFRLPGEGEKPEHEQTGWSGGFDVVLGNPPWERVKLQEKEWFAVRCPEIANAPNAAARRRLIAALEQEDPELYAAFLADRRKAEGESHYIRNSNRYPLCGRGDVNTYTIFAESMRSIISSTGRVGCIVPSGIATDDTTKFFFQALMDKRSLVSLYDFENREGIFEGVHRSYKFCLLTLTGTGSPAAGAEFVFFAHRPEDLQQEERRFTLSAEDIALLNPNTRTCPIFRSKRDAELTKSIYRRVPVLIKESPPEENPWKVKITRTFDMARFSDQSKTRETLLKDDFKESKGRFIRDSEDWIPVYESKMIWHYDHRYSSYDNCDFNDINNGKPKIFSKEQKKSPCEISISRYWLPGNEVRRLTSWHLQPYWIAFRDITNATNERTMVGSIIPRHCSDYTLRLIFGEIVTGRMAACLLANINSFVLDFISRQFVAGTHFSDFITQQLPIYPPQNYIRRFCLFDNVKNWVSQRALELTYTAWDLKPFAQYCGYDGPPFRWDEERRFKIRCELDAAYFHLYGIAREDVDYIMETFPIVKLKDEEKYGSYRTKELILTIYDAMQQAIVTGQPYQTILDPPPADPRCAHPPRQE
ncbi:MAG: class I SAM-dependent DNA methyltransferase, partial [Firmicutes bacterium]|nr:class I SAM-dependent DNA methyltransferase [Bacillota bacterium]